VIETGDPFAQPAERMSRIGSPPTPAPGRSYPERHNKKRATGGGEIYTRYFNEVEEFPSKPNGNNVSVRSLQLETTFPIYA
jgi:phosphoribosylformylglycinamidine (FGAM) synthase-like amidotransferase family enzyme